MNIFDFYKLKLNFQQPDQAISVDFQSPSTAEIFRYLKQS